ncbi:hypothetical protein H5410_006552 [Solanum commersonii]|uniref:GH3 middle domain-containing protein n=1 Tax=Solanum commersonii TaxID=4109 RepID=A0A9J6A9H0_SOLCO|nr:hypothetical protein H5410_006552 [Solanum commersonii]
MPTFQRVKLGGATDRGYIQVQNANCDSGTSAGERKLMPTTQDELDRKQRSTAFSCPDHLKMRPYDPFNVYPTRLFPEHLFIFSNSIGKLLAKDIAFGILNRRVSDPSIREAKTRIWKGFITRIWPNTNNLDVIVTGLTTPSRGPSQRGSGKKYELTTYVGICRYRVGDILQVMGFHNSAPHFKLQSTLVMPTLKPFQDIMLFTANYLLRTQPMLFGNGRKFELGLSTVPSCGQLNWRT